MWPLVPHAASTRTYEQLQDDEAYSDRNRDNNSYHQDDGYSNEGQRSRAEEDWRTRPDPMEDDSYQYQPKHHSKGKRLLPSEASQHVIFLGLDPDFVESDVSKILFHDALL
jgi:RNA-binding protein 5/10